MNLIALLALLLAPLPTLWRLPALWRCAGLLGLGLLAIGAQGWLVAVLAPFGVILPALALQRLAAWGGLIAPPWRKGDLLLLLAAHVLFFALSLGLGPIDPYRFGYDPIWGSLIAFAVLLGLVWRGQLWLAGAALLGQILWSCGIGPENIFSHLTHALILPVLAVALLRPSKRG